MKEFKLQNYTTSISADRSIAEIEQLLILFGATHIMKEYYGDGRVLSFNFKIGLQSFKLPNNSEGVYQVLFSNKRKNRHINGEKKRWQHSENVAWRVLRDWVHSQLTMVAMKQVEPAQVFLSYTITNMKTGRTLWTDFKERTLSLTHKETEEDK